MRKLLLLLCWLSAGLWSVGCGDLVEERDTERENGPDSEDEPQSSDAEKPDGGDEGTPTDPDGSTDPDGNSDPDSEPEILPDPLLIQAECAISGFSGDCNGDFSGGTSECDAVWGQAPSYPHLDPENDAVVGFFNGGCWIRIDGVNLTQMNTVKMHLANATAAEGLFEIRLGSPDGMRIASVASPITGEGEDWTVFETVTAVLKGSFSGENDVYVIAVNPDIGNGNLDWLEFSADPDVEIDTDPDQESSRIQAECAVGPDAGDCNGAYTGGTSHSEPLWGGAEDYPAIDPADPGTVGYFTDGSWIRIDGVDLTDMTTVTASVAGQNDGTGFYVTLDSPDSTPVAGITVGNTGGWTVYAEVEDTLDGTFTGAHDVYFVGESPDPENTGVGNLDWFEFH